MKITTLSLLTLFCLIGCEKASNLNTDSLTLNIQCKGEHESITVNINKGYIEITDETWLKPITEAKFVATDSKVNITYKEHFNYPDADTLKYAINNYDINRYSGSYVSKTIQFLNSGKSDEYFNKGFCIDIAKKF